MAKITTILFCIFIAVFTSHVSAEPIPCGKPKPPASPYGQHTVEVWQDCKDLTWHIKAYHGKLKGTIFLSDLAVMHRDGVTPTKNSKLKLNNGEMKSTIDFDIVVPKKDETKEFSFAVPLYARMVLVMKPGSKASVRYGDLIDQSGITNLINPPDVDVHTMRVETK